MDTIKIEKANVRMIAHRGVSGIECENTNAAFVAAGNRSYWGVETDVHMTADGKFVIIHDDTTGRVCDTDVSVEGSSLAELQALKLKNPKVDEYRADYKTPELSEYIGICKKYGKLCVLELKNRIPKEGIAQIVKIAEEAGYPEGMVYITFDWDNIIDLREVMPESNVQCLERKCDDELIAKLRAYKVDLDVYYGSVTPELVQKIHDAGLLLNCWTVDDKEEAEKLAAMGIDFITTNILE